MAGRRVSVTAQPYGFRAVSAADLPMLTRWLRTPTVARWWGDPRREIALLREDLHEPRMTMQIVSFRGRPFAYLQHYEIDAWPQRHFAALPRGTRAIDTFIGEPTMLGRGHGARYLRLAASLLLHRGGRLVAIDPDLDNQRARRAYRRAGFVERAIVAADGGEVALMTFGRWPSSAP
jgi:aminoglycoside 6'-N-acetyltransferase